MNARLFLLLSFLLVFAVSACDQDGVSPGSPRMFEVTLENVSQVFDFTASGTFNTPAGEGAPGPLGPGGVYEFEFMAGPGTSLSFATMFVESNDFFYAPDGDGLPLFDAMGQQITGDVTSSVYLWDSGTEVDQEPGLGADQAPRQAGPNTGAADATNQVRLAADTYGNLPAVSDVIQVSLESTGATSFRLRIENVSTSTTLSTSDAMMHPVPLAPGVWVVHSAPGPLFTAGEADRGEGLEALAEDGDASVLGDALAARTGLTSPISPGVFAVHQASPVLFASGQADAGEGLESLAEDGDPSALATAVAAKMGVTASGAFDTPVGAAGAGPAFPGQSYSFAFEAAPGDMLSFATMLVQSNDLFFAPGQRGIELFPGGSALDGEVTGETLLWDAGTEVNEAPGVGLDQAPRQASANSGPDENGTVRQINDGYEYPDVADVIRVTIRPTN